MAVVITFGTFDVFHVGHVNIFKRAKGYGSRLIVGVSSDELNIQKKGRAPIYSLKSRMEIIESIKYVDEAFVEESLDLKRRYILDNKADVLVMGNDWEGAFDQFKDICQVHYLPRTPSISTTEIIEVIKDIS
jgi:glycerol-3-phosphate cytidylyltransferase